MTGSRRRDENSGLIDLDALLKEASEPQLPRADDSLEGIATPQPPVPVPEPEPTKPSAMPESGSRTKAVEPIAVIKSVPPPPAPEPAPAPAPAIAIAAAPPPAEPRRRSLPILLVAIGIVGAVVAFVVLRAPGVATPRAASAQPVLPPETKPAAPATAATIDEHAAGGTLDAKDLPAASTASAAPSAQAPPASLRPNPTAVASAKVTTFALPDSPAGERGDLGGAMREAVGPRDDTAGSATKEATTTPGARQLRPSPGAVVGAINSVLPAARECLGPDDPVRSATIVFRSDGAVARVEMSGERETDACVRAALSRARVAPFVDDTFAARATVRP